jgi:hypothetical protein
MIKKASSWFITRKGNPVDTIITHPPTLPSLQEIYPDERVAYCLEFRDIYGYWPQEEYPGEHKELSDAFSPFPSQEK